MLVLLSVHPSHADSEWSLQRHAEAVAGRCSIVPASRRKALEINPIAGQDASCSDLRGPCELVLALADADHHVRPASGAPLPTLCDGGQPGWGGLKGPSVRLKDGGTPATQKQTADKTSLVVVQVDDVWLERSHDPAQRAQLARQPVVRSRSGLPRPVLQTIRPTAPERRSGQRHDVAVRQLQRKQRRQERTEPSGDRVGHMQNPPCHPVIVATCYKGRVRLRDWRLMIGADVSESHGLSPIAGLAKGTLLGRMLLTMRRCRRAPLIAYRARRAERADLPTLPPGDGRRNYRVLYVIPAGPGEWSGLRDTIESILHYEDADTKIVVADDCSIDSRSGVVRREFPQVDVIRARWPSCGGFRIYPMLASVVDACLRRYEFETLAKFDTDALMTGPGLGAEAVERFRKDPGLGMVGTYRVRGDGVAEDYTLDRWLLERQMPRSRALRELVETASNHGYTGEKCLSGVCFFARAALEAADSQGLLHSRLPWWMVLGDDTRLTLMTLAAGHRLGSIGGPRESTMIAPHILPMPKEAVQPQGKLAVHSTRQGLHGESEAEIRGYFKAIRQDEAAGLP